MRHRKGLILALVASLLFFSAQARAEDPTIAIYSLGSVGAAPTLLGTLTLKENLNGVLMTPQLKLPEGIHAMRLVPKTLCTATAILPYTQPSTDEDSSAAPPFLPPLIVDSTNNAVEIVMARGLTLKDFQQKTVLIYANENPYPDQTFPKFAGDVMACGGLK